MVFDVPQIRDNPLGWGPLDPKDSEIPYAPYSKSDRVGKVADWTSQGQYQQRTFNRQQQAYGPVATAFGYVHDLDEDRSFQVVEVSKGPPRPKFQRRYPQRISSALIRKDQQPPDGRFGKGKMQQQRGGYSNQNRNRMQEKPARFNESSIEVGKDWSLVEQIPFLALQKLSAEIGEPTEISQHGALGYYDKQYDRITTKAPKNLQRFDSLTFHSVTTTDDPVIRQLATEGHGNVFATDQILSLLMSCTRSVFSWDIIAERVGTKLFFDKRDGSRFDLLTVNETAGDIVIDPNDPVNNLSNLSQEATFINQNFSQQVLTRGTSFDFPNPNPFAAEGEPVASVGYRYRKWDLGNDMVLVARTAIDGVLQKEGANTFVNIKALNEFDSRLTGVDWRTKLASQPGAVLVTELKNNANKIARWTAEALLGGADQIKIGYVSRVHPKDQYHHVILGTQYVKPRDLAAQINLSPQNLWGVLKALVDLLMKLPEGKYCVLKDPAKPLLRVYEVPQAAFEDADAAEEAEGEAKEGDDAAPADETKA